MSIPIPARSLAERGQNAASLLRTYFLPNTAGDVEALIERVAQLEAEASAMEAVYKKRYEWALHERDMAQGRAAQIEARWQKHEKHDTDGQ